MKRILLSVCAFLCAIPAAFGENSSSGTNNPTEQKRDTIYRQYEVPEVRVRTSAKETQSLMEMPGAVSVIGPGTVNSRGIESVKDLSIGVPNLFIPDYGSKMTTPIYLRGIGARSSGQSIGMYVDNIPYMDKSTFDFELMDIQRIEVLRGPQGTLYGRNAMGGIVNVHTWSPFDRQGHKISVGMGNYNTWEAKLSKYNKVSEKFAFSVTAYWNKEGGYFGNLYTGKKADDSESAGGRLKLEWRITPQLKATLASSYDYTDQNSFAYGLYHKDTDVIDPVNYNDRGSYLRNMTNNSLRFEYTTDKLLFSSNTGYQYLKDNMWMDQDFTSQDIFTINQRQYQNSFNQEFSVRSITDKNYQWSVGAFGFYNHLNTTGNVLFKKDGIQNVLQPVFDNMMPPTVPINLVITDTEIPNPGRYRTPSVGGALFHQSTFNNLLTDGLSLTLGLRMDYEKQYLKYNTSMGMNLNAYGKPPMPPILMGSYEVSKTLKGKDHQDFLEWLPKVALKYDFGNDMMVYGTVSKGHKAGGYNIQMFSEVIQNSMKTWRPPGMPPVSGDGTGNLKDALSYKPEKTWNYEVGFRQNSLLNGKLSIDAALFFMSIKDVQLTQFPEGGSGRILTNAGRGRSYGAEVSMSLNQLIKGVNFDLNYGYTNATFRDYNDGRTEYRGNYIPYVPQHTFAVGAAYSQPLSRKLTLNTSLQYAGAGKMYWTEANDISQSFYGLLNGKIGLSYDFVRVDFWANNILKKEYGAFYFESFGNSFIQKGKPFTCGVKATFSF